MSNVIQHVVINGKDELVVLNGNIILSSEETDFSDEVQRLQSALNCKVEVEEIDEPKDSDWNYDDVVEIIPSYREYLEDKKDDSVVETERDSFEFYLVDESQVDNHMQAGIADAKSDLGLSLYFEGYGDCCSKDDSGTPVYIEKYDGELRVLVYADINKEEPTHSISLEGALLSKRIEG